MNLNSWELWLSKIKISLWVEAWNNCRVKGVHTLVQFRMTCHLLFLWNQRKDHRDRVIKPAETTYPTHLTDKKLEKRRFMIL